MESPGPGHYEGIYDHSAFLQREQLSKTDQAFGCLKPRFEDAYTEDFHLQRVRGPGTYHHDKVPIKKHPSRKSVGFHSQEKRQLNLGSNSLSEEVGPASYKIKGIAEQVKTFNKSQAVSQFGIAQKRFHQLTKPDQPGPADYVPDKSLAILNSKNQDLNTAGHSMFLNKEQRLPPQRDEGPPVGAYEPHKNQEIAKITINKDGKNKEAHKGRAISTSIQVNPTLKPSASSFSAQIVQNEVPQHRFANDAHSKNVQKNIQSFVESCRGPGSYENSNRDPKIYGGDSRSTAANSKATYFGRNNSSPMRPKGLIKAGRNMMQSESEGKLMALNQLANAMGGEQMQPSFSSLQQEKIKQRNMRPGPGEYEIDMWRAVGANKSFNLKYL